ncbi:MAG: hypothetical protein MHMPM18_003534 [Marteilia pararefringens]
MFECEIAFEDNICVNFKYTCDTRQIFSHLSEEINILNGYIYNRDFYFDTGKQFVKVPILKEYPNFELDANNNQTIDYPPDTNQSMKNIQISEDFISICFDSLNVYLLDRKSEFSVNSLKLINEKLLPGSSIVTNTRFIYHKKSPLIIMSTLIEIDSDSYYTTKVASNEYPSNKIIGCISQVNDKNVNYVAIGFSNGQVEILSCESLKLICTINTGLNHSPISIHISKMCNHSNYLRNNLNDNQMSLITMNLIDGSLKDYLFDFKNSETIMMTPLEIFDLSLSINPTNYRNCFNNEDEKNINLLKNLNNDEKKLMINIHSRKSKWVCKNALQNKNIEDIDDCLSSLLFKGILINFREDKKEINLDNIIKLMSLEECKVASKKMKFGSIKSKENFIEKLNKDSHLPKITKFFVNFTPSKSANYPIIEKLISCIKREFISLSDEFRELMDRILFLSFISAIVMSNIEINDRATL